MPAVKSYPREIAPRVREHLAVRYLPISSFLAGEIRRSSAATARWMLLRPRQSCASVGVKVN